MARPATGSPRWNAEKEAWEARITIAGLGRKPVAISNVGKCERSPACNVPALRKLGKEPCENCTRAWRRAQIMSDKARAEGMVPEETGETATEWYRDRYLPLHERLGNTTGGHIGSWMKWVAPFIGTIPMHRVTRTQIVAARDNLAEARRLGKIGAKRAQNVWGDQIATPFRRAFWADHRNYGSVNVGPASANPALGVDPPVSGADIEEDERERQALEPSQFLALVSCKKVPLQDRREDAVKAYSGLSPSEYYGLLCADVRIDDERPHFRVQRGRDMKTGDDKSTKTKARKRRVPIHPELLPLLRVMLAEINDPAARLFPIGERVRDAEKKADIVKAHLLLAGITDRELQDGSDTLMPFDDRSWRTTFATWCAKAGYDSAWVRVWLGHKPKGTAEKHYVKDTPAFEDVATKVRPGVVPPFPPLPIELIEGTPSIGEGFGGRPIRAGNHETFSCEGGELNRGYARSEPSAENGREAEKIASSAIDAPSDDVTVSDDANGQNQNPIDPDDALRIAIKAAVDAGDLARASALLDVLKNAPKPAPVLTLAARERK